MFGDKPRSLPQRIALILVPDFTMMPVTSAIEPLRTRTSPSAGLRERSRARASFVSAARSAAMICASSSEARASSAAVSETDPVAGVEVDCVEGRAAGARRCSRDR